MVNLWLAYVTRDEPSRRSRDYLDKATKASPRLVFPFRNETIPVLQWAARQRHDWQILYYLGLTCWSKGRYEEAGRMFKECGNTPDYGPFYLARAEFLKKIGEESPIEDYRRVFSLAPDEWRTWLALARLYSEQSAFRDALDVAKRGFQKFPNDFVLGIEYARALIDTAQYQAALDLLDNLTVLPYEGAGEGHVLYEKANLSLAVENMRRRKYQEALAFIAKSREWPEHLGVGRPYDPDERLQEYLESYSQRELGKAGGKKVGTDSLNKLKGDLKNTSPWKYDVLIAVSR
jgi:tetratricopeptide (TPR) repeat protein